MPLPFAVVDPVQSAVMPKGVEHYCSSAPEDFTNSGAVSRDAERR